MSSAGGGYEEDLATIQASSSQSKDPCGPRYYSLIVLEGPDQGRSFRVDPTSASRALLGQSEAYEVRLSDRQVSRRHAAFEATGDRLRLTDLGSSNGTVVDGVSVIEAFLRGGELVRVGGSILRVERGAVQRASTLPEVGGFGRVVGSSAAMRRLYQVCERLAKSSIPVVIEGETGTGKELLAEALHEAGPRSAGPFVVFDCTAVPASLVESELFGHERGAFTGAIGSRKGLFELAHGGTLLIDEIGDLEPALQPKLLRALERSEVRRIGGDRPLRVDVRVLSATRRDLDREVQAGRFRDDLFHRLAVARIELPPLRRREGDVGRLVQHFWRALSPHEGDLDPETLKRFEDYAWPGNVRELRNAVARRLALGELGHLESARIVEGEGPTADSNSRDDLFALPYVEARRQVVEDFERQYVARVLERHGGNVTRAAEASGLARRSLQLIKGRQRR